MHTDIRIGSIGWVDLTVERAGEVRDFYHAVVGWDTAPVEMGSYQDYSMIPVLGGDPVAGICHARGENASLPPQWLMYVYVAALDRSIQRCVEMGGKLLGEPRHLGSFGTMCVIQDPAGAVLALVEPPSAP